MVGWEAGAGDDVTGGGQAAGHGAMALASGAMAALAFWALVLVGVWVTGGMVFPALGHLRHAEGIGYGNKGQAHGQDYAQEQDQDEAHRATAMVDSTSHRNGRRRPEVCRE